LLRDETTAGNALNSTTTRNNGNSSSNSKREEVCENKGRTPAVPLTNTCNKPSQEGGLARLPSTLLSYEDGIKSGVQNSTLRGNSSYMQGGAGSVKVGGKMQSVGGWTMGGGGGGGLDLPSHISAFGEGLEEQQVRPWQTDGWKGLHLMLHLYSVLCVCRVGQNQICTRIFGREIIKCTSNTANIIWLWPTLCVCQSCLPPAFCLLLQQRAEIHRLK